jgi:hypothetical protein
MAEVKKPRLTLADVEAFSRAKSLEWGTVVFIDGVRAVYSGVQGNSVCFRIKSRNTYIQAGDPRLRELTV